MSESQPSLLLRGQDVQQLIGVSRVTLWRMTRSGDFPQSIRIGARSNRWLRSEVEAWIRLRPRSGEAA